MGLETDPASAARSSDTRRDVARFPVVGVGVSAADLEACEQLLQALPADTGMAFVVVPHDDPSHRSLTREVLARATPMPVTEAQDEQRLEPNHVYVLSSNRTMLLADSHLRLSPRDTVPGPHRPIDTFMQSLARDQAHSAIAVILSGTGTDGMLGLEAIKSNGGITFAQDATARPDAMPRSAIAAGCVDFVLPPAAIAEEIARIACHPHMGPVDQPTGGLSTTEAVANETSPTVTAIVQLLHDTTGVDFTQYKATTLCRRINRRMLLLRLRGLDDYLHVLQRHPGEVQNLYRDLLISVTAFFRDPPCFEAIRQKVLPRLLGDRPRREPVRVWVLGCSTGEETYSLAISIAEFAAEYGLEMPAQIFATDLNEESLEKARAGRYPKTISQDVSPEQLRRFFVETEDGYRVVQRIREMCVFARHNVLSDPPFSRLDLVSCRNLLIYLEPTFQRRLVPVLHYALKPGGVLWLGCSESVGGFGDLFEASCEPRHKIFVRKPGAPVATLGLVAPAWDTRDLARGRLPRSESDTTDLQREADRIVVTKYAPPSVLVNADLDVQQFRGDTSPYLTQPPGKPTTNLLKMAREGLLVPLRSAVQRVRAEGTGVREEGVRVKTEAGFRTVDLEILPVGGSGAERCFLAFFEDADRRTQPVQPAPPVTVAATVRSEDAESEIARLTQELVATREYMQALVEQQEAANEELQSANEEIQSANEELQSVNEELQTSKEEIQSSNEELTTVNDELCHRNDQLARAQDDLNNFIASSQLPMVMVGPDLRIRRFSPAAECFWGLIAADVGRPVESLKLPFVLPDLEERLIEVMAAAGAYEREVQDRKGQWYSLRLRPYRTVRNEIDGAVIILVDIGAQKRAQEEIRAAEASLRESEQRYRHLVHALPAAVYTCDAEGMVTLFNEAAVTLWGREPGVGTDVWSGAWRTLRPDGTPLPRDAYPMAAAMRSGRPVRGEEIVIERPDGTRTRVLAHPVPMLDAEGKVIGAINMLVDLTELDRTEAALRESKTQLQAALSAAQMGTWRWDFDEDRFVPDASLRSLMGFAPGEDIGGLDGFLNAMHPADRAGARAAFEAAVPDGAELDTEFRVVWSDGAVRWIKARGNVISRPSSAPCLTGACVDISDRVVAAERLRAADKRKDEFLATLAHELRNPLAPLATTLEILRRPGTDPASVARGREMMERQVRKLTRLVDDLLDVARISRGRVELRREALDLRTVIERAVESVQHHFTTARHDLAIGLPPEPVVVDGDAIRLEQVVANLLHNAAAYTDPGGRIALALEVTDGDGDRPGNDAVVRVRDTGVGLTPELLLHVFDFFARGDVSYARHSGGLGIGLSLVKSLVELHEGRVEAHSAGRGQGSEFVVRIPLRADAAPSATDRDERPRATTSGGPQASGRRILVVDDNIDAADVTAQLLRACGHEVAVAHSGPAALDAAVAFRPEVVFLDIGMPGMDGYEVARRLRRLAGSETTRLVALSGYGTEEDRRRAREAGFDAHLVKPADLAALTAAATAGNAVATPHASP